MLSAVVLHVHERFHRSLPHEYLKALFDKIEVLIESRILSFLEGLSVCVVYASQE